MKNKLSGKSLLKDNRFVFAISLVFAIAIWIMVSPVRETSVSVTVPIDTANTSADTLGLEIIEGQGQTVSVDIKGKWYIISEVTDKDIKINYSLSDITKAGEYEIALSASKVSPAADYDIEGVTPEKIKVKFDYIYSRSFKIEAKANNIKAEEGYIVDSPVIDSESSIIDITGPMSIVENINSVVAEVDDKATLKASASYSAKLKLLDSDGNEIDKSALTMPFNEVNVTIPINKSKTVPLFVAFSNQPDYYKENPLGYTLSVDKIKIIGSSEIIDTIESITLDTIDFSEISDSKNTFKFPLKLPSGVKTVDDISEVEVKIDTSQLSSKSLEITDFRVASSPSGTTVKVLTSKKAVNIVGPKSVISDIDAKDVYLQCDMSGTSGTSGEFVVNSVLKSGKYNNIWGCGEYQIQIKVE